MYTTVVPTVIDVDGSFFCIYIVYIVYSLGKYLDTLKKKFFIDAIG